MRNKDFIDRNILLMWLLVLILNIFLMKAGITRKLDKIEKQNKEIIEYIKNGDVEE